MRLHLVPFWVLPMFAFSVAVLGPAESEPDELDGGFKYGVVYTLETVVFPGGIPVAIVSTATGYRKKTEIATTRWGVITLPPGSKFVFSPMDDRIILIEERIRPATLVAGLLHS